MSESGKFFNEFANKFDTFYDGKRSQWMQWIDKHFRSDMFIRFKLTFDFLKNIKRQSIVDIGCGSGPYIVEALSKGAQKVIGIDPAPRMLDLARQRVDNIGMNDRVVLLEGYFPETKPKNYVDYAIVIGVMDYISDPVTFLKNLRNVINKGAVLSFPSTHWFRAPFRKIRYTIRKCPVYFFNEHKIEKLLNDAGFIEFSITKIPGAGMDYVVNISK